MKPPDIPGLKDHSCQIDMPMDMEKTVSHNEECWVTTCSPGRVPGLLVSTWPSRSCPVISCLLSCCYSQREGEVWRRWSLHIGPWADERILFVLPNLLAVALVGLHLSHILIHSLGELLINLQVNPQTIPSNADVKGKTARLTPFCILWDGPIAHSTVPLVVLDAQSSLEGPGRLSTATVAI